MASSERIFVQAIRRYCAGHGIAVDIRAGGWLIAMRRGEERRFAFGYDIGLNSAIAHRLANDKSATAEALALECVPCIPHHLFLNPKLGRNVVDACLARGDACAASRPSARRCREAERGDVGTICVQGDDARRSSTTRSARCFR